MSAAQEGWLHLTGDRDAACGHGGSERRRQLPDSKSSWEILSHQLPVVSKVWVPGLMLRTWQLGPLAARRGA